MSSAVAALLGFARASTSRPRALERCELCAAVLDPARHEHLFETSARRLACACAACAACFDGSREGRSWARVVSRIERLDSTLDAPTWTALGVPVRLAYFTQPSAGEPLAILPSPAGPIASQLPEGGWSALSRRVPVVSALSPDVEGVLAWDHDGKARAYRMSIDHAYRAIGVLRARARGATAGELARILEDEVLPALETEAH